MPKSGQVQLSLEEKRTSERAQLEYLQGYSMLSIIPCLAGLSIWYESYLLLYALFAITPMAFLFLFVRRKLGQLSGLYAGFVLIIFHMLILQMILPEGQAAAILLFPLGVAIFSTSPSILIASIFFGSTLAIRASFATLGIPTGLAKNLPEFQLALAVLLPMLFSSLYTVLSQRNKNKLVLEAYHEAENQLIVERIQVRTEQQQLEKTTRNLSTETEKLQNRLRQQRKLVLALNERREDEAYLIQAIHHDLREPLRSIVSFSQLVARKLSGTPEEIEVKDMLSYAVDGGKRMTVMLNDLMSYAQQSQEEEMNAVDLSQIGEDVLQDLADLIQRTGAQVTIDALPIMQGYRTQLRQLFLNLISNSLKFSRPSVPPKMNISLEVIPRKLSDLNKLTIQFSDNGIGIPSNQLAKVFGLFNRAHNNEGYEGSGVGLALCRRIAIAHQSKLEVISMQGEGTTFRLHIPIHLVLRIPQDVDYQLYLNKRRLC